MKIWLSTESIVSYEQKRRGKKDKKWTKKKNFATEMDENLHEMPSEHNLEANKWIETWRLKWFICFESRI